MHTHIHAHMYTYNLHVCIQACTKRCMYLYSKYVCMYVRIRVSQMHMDVFLFARVVHTCVLLRILLSSAIFIVA